MRILFVLPTGLLTVGLIANAGGNLAVAAGNADAGARVYRACAGCHALEPGRHLSGPSLAGIWERKAASDASFPRYSDVLKGSNLTWNEKTLDQWFANPKALVPDNYMVFPGLKDPKARADLIAYLKGTSDGSIKWQSAEAAGARGPVLVDLKTLAGDQQVNSISYCRGTYRVTTVDGKTTPFWEFNLRFKTDTSEDGPVKGRPALLPAGMGGDRALVIFSTPGEISSVIKEKC